MTRSPQAKFTATVNVDAVALLEFRKAVLVSRGRLYGFLGTEATCALRAHGRRLLGRNSDD